MGFNNKTRLVITFTIFVIVQSYCGASKITAISTYSSTSPNVSFENWKPATTSRSHQISASASNSKDSFAARKDTSGNVIFNDNFAFTSSATQAEGGGSKRKKYLFEEQKSDFSHETVAEGHLKNHRLEGGPISLSADIVSAAAASAVSSPFYNNNNEQINDNSRQRNVHRANDANIVEGASGHGRAYTQFSQGPSHQGYGWASNPGSCLFSCSSGNIGNGGAVSCCQQNYVQCCPNPYQETLNFKNLHHGRGHLGGNLGKSGYAWGPPPYNPPPIIRPQPCQPYHGHAGIVTPIVHGAGALVHRGIETIKSNFHNIGAIFKDHGGAGIGWGSGNGAAGYYFHRRSDNSVDGTQAHYSSQKKRLKRSLHKGSEFVQPCPVYSAPPNFGWAGSRPPSIGLGSLIGWSKPGNHIQAGFIGGGGGGYGYGNLYRPGYSVGGGGGGYGWGWGNTVGPGQGVHHCKLDFECPGSQKCCKGVCQFAPYF